MSFYLKSNAISVFQYTYLKTQIQKSSKLFKETIFPKYLSVFNEIQCKRVVNLKTSSNYRIKPCHNPYVYRITGC